MDLIASQLWARYWIHLEASSGLTPYSWLLHRNRHMLHPLKPILRVQCRTYLLSPNSELDLKLFVARNCTIFKKSRYLQGCTSLISYQRATWSLSLKYVVPLSRSNDQLWKATLHPCANEALQRLQAPYTQIFSMIHLLVIPQSPTILF